MGVLPYYKCNTGEFTGITGPVRVSRFLTVLRKAEKELEASRAELAKVLLEQSRSVGAAVTKVLDGADQLREPPEDRASTLKDYVNLIASRMAARRDVSAEVSGVLSLYLRLDVEALLTDLKTVGMLSDGGDKEVAARNAKIKSLREAVQSGEERIQKLWNTEAPKCFVRGAPSVYFIEQVGGTKEKAVPVFLRRFEEAWRERAKLFAVPVTVYGTAISSLPDEDKKAWQRAYDTLQLFPATHANARYTASRHSGVA